LDKGSPKVDGIVWHVPRKFEKWQSPTGCWVDVVKPMVRTRFEGKCTVQYSYEIKETFLGLMILVKL
jgi:hypothetical protein